MGIGVALRQLMDARKQNVAQVAVVSGMDIQKVYYILKHDPASGDVLALKRLADAYGVTLDFFVNPDLEIASDEAALLQHFRKTNVIGRRKMIDYSSDMEKLYLSVGK